jgi:hypothetical protein
MLEEGAMPVNDDLGKILFCFLAISDRETGRLNMEGKKKMKGARRHGKRQPPIKIPLTFEKTVKGILGLSPEDAKDVREKAAKPKK